MLFSQRIDLMQHEIVNASCQYVIFRTPNFLKYFTLVAKTITFGSSRIMVKEVEDCITVLFIIVKYVLLFLDIIIQPHIICHLF